MDNQQNIYGAQIEQLKEYAFFFMDVDGRVRTWNAGVQHLLGYSATEWINQHTSIIFTPADQAVTLCDSEMAIAREQGSASDIRWHRKKDGTELFANGVLSAVYDSSGKLQGFTKIISDETARKQLEDSLVQANAALEISRMPPAMTCKSPFEPLAAMHNFFSGSKVIGSIPTGTSTWLSSTARFLGWAT